MTLTQTKRDKATRQPISSFPQGADLWCDDALFMCDSIWAETGPPVERFELWKREGGRSTGRQLLINCDTTVEVETLEHGFEAARDRMGISSDELHALLYPAIFISL